MAANHENEQPDTPWLIMEVTTPPRKWVVPTNLPESGHATRSICRQCKRQGTCNQSWGCYQPKWLWETLQERHQQQNREA